MVGCVYFVYNSSTRLVKIGRTNEPCPYKRLSSLAGTWHVPGKFIQDLQLLGIIPTADQTYTSLKRDLQAKFRDYSVKAEWFWPAAELLDFISSQSRGHACRDCAVPAAVGVSDKEHARLGRLASEPR